ncbi:hypothetical protein SISSUDRAFT_124391 [Sistotremastrum suecicum HHB10207 ss-3]|uniref:RING-type domain-containing protein n=1 Tax=Sistotremastrum suecicum HHB10207 ss-3 TaxID=1314776 RepID=A0A166B0F2_9AGAM|nr:hypothetical protein SISSUDRAFT_124391 [Sistotremastrum suecicum HHB10207 ss-3]
MPPNRFKCSICLQSTNLSSALTTTCGHVFHKPCIEKWQNESDQKPGRNKCPQCRREYKGVHPMYITPGSSSPSRHSQRDEDASDASDDLDLDLLGTSRSLTRTLRALSANSEPEEVLEATTRLGGLGDYESDDPLIKSSLLDLTRRATELQQLFTREIATLRNQLKERNATIAQKDEEITRLRGQVSEMRQQHGDVTKKKFDEQQRRLNNYQTKLAETTAECKRIKEFQEQLAEENQRLKGRISVKEANFEKEKKEWTDKEQKLRTANVKLKQKVRRATYALQFVLRSDIAA